MRTAFSFQDDKQLVQLARSYVDSESRITWTDIAHRMRSTGHTSKALQQRLRTLMRTWGSNISRFPPSFFTEVRRPRGRLPAVTRRLRQRATGSEPQRSQQTSEVSSVKSPTSHGLAYDAPNDQDGRVLERQEGDAPTVVEDVQDALVLTADPPAAPLTPANAEQPSDRLPSIFLSCAKQAGDHSPSMTPSSVEQTDEPSPPMTPSSLEQAITAMFADIPRKVVEQGQNTPHRNAGEVMPDGVTTLLAELGPIDGRDVFLDIGAGVGNIVAQVALGTGVYKALGIEQRRDIYQLGMDMMTKSAYAGRLLERTQIVCQDLSDVRISYTPPFADATIVYWNNLLFDPSVIEYVKRTSFAGCSWCVF